MKLSQIIPYLTVFSIFLITACSVQWTETIKYGRIVNETFNEKVNIEVNKGLIFLPVNIHGKEYRFLFDSGAPFSISEQLQSEYAFKIVSNGNIIDSDHNRKKVDWVQVDSILIGDVLFEDHVAFIGNFKTNHMLKCLNIDGIVGSNIIRQCNWTIDQTINSLSLFNSINIEDFKDHTAIPFKTDHQYNIFVDIAFGRSKVSNILVDYGSNGAIALNNEIFSILTDRNVFGEIHLENGYQQSGIIGEAVQINRKITFTDSVDINGMQVENVMLKTGPTVSVGNELLSRFNLTIDWENQRLYLNRNGKPSHSNRSPGFRLGFSNDKGVYVQSVIEGSNAYQNGIRPNMKVMKVDNLDFENGDDFCDFVNHALGDKIFMQLTDNLGQELECIIERTVY